MLDILAGKSFSYLFEHTNTGSVGKHNYIGNKAMDEVVVLGSSRALRHYNSQLLSDSLGLSCYNCGQSNNGIILSYGYYKLLRQRYSPKMVICEIYPYHDLLIEGDNHTSLGLLKDFYDKDGIPEIFNSVDGREKYKMLSQMYRYNSYAFKILRNYFFPKNEFVKGFLPHRKKFDGTKVKSGQFGEMVFDSLKISYLHRMIDESKDTKLVFVVSPMWNGLDTAALMPLYDMCKTNGIELINFSNSPKYLHHDEFFKDGIHLNDIGADEFTKDLITRFKNENIK